MGKSVNLIYDDLLAVIELLYQLPDGIEEDADENDESPYNLTAHVGGLAIQALRKIVERLEDESP